MQALVFNGLKELAVEDAPEPQPAQGEVLVDVEACGICGSDVHGYLGFSARRLASVPLIMGHEFTGRIAEISSDVDDATGRPLSVGDRVVVQPQIACGHCRACRAGYRHICPEMLLLGIEQPGGFAQRVAVPANRLFPMPDNLSELDGTVVEALAVQVHLFRQTPLTLSRNVVILGAGAQGLLALQLARLTGAEQVTVTDVVPQRLALAERLGASATIQADQEDVVARVMEMTDGWGVEFVVDCVGIPATQQEGVAMLAPRGTFGAVGLRGPTETKINFAPIVNKELSLRGTYCYTDDDFERALELIASKQIQVKEMVHAAPLSEGVTYFDRLINEPAGLTKVVLKPN